MPAWRLPADRFFIPCSLFDIIVLKSPSHECPHSVTRSELCGFGAESIWSSEFWVLSSEFTTEENHSGVISLMPAWRLPADRFFIPCSLFDICSQFT